MVDNDLPPELQKTWQIHQDELQIVLGGPGQPVILGRGAYGSVRTQAVMCS